MRIFCLASLAFALAASGPARAADWYLVATTNEAGNFVDKASIVERGPLRTADGISFGFEPHPSGVRSMETRSDWDCAARTTALVAAKAFRVSGELIYEGTILEAERRVDAIPPNSVPSELLAFICGRDDHPDDWLPIRVGRAEDPPAVMARAARLKALGIPPPQAMALAAVDPAGRRFKTMFEAAVPRDKGAEAKAIVAAGAQ